MACNANRATEGQPTKDEWWKNEAVKGERIKYSPERKRESERVRERGEERERERETGNERE